MPDEVQLSAHDAAMVAKADAVAAAVHVPAPLTATNQPAAPVVPAEPVVAPVVPAEPAPVEPPKEPEPKPVEPPKEPEPVPAAPVKADFVKIAAEVNETGVISEDSYKALEAVGFDRSLADAFIAGQQALAEKNDAAAMALVGGKETYESMKAWAATSFSDAAKEAFNSAVVSANPATREMAIRSLASSYEAAVGRVPGGLPGAAASGGSTGAYSSRAEVIAAMSDPRYKKDAAYRAEVERRVGDMPSF